jgi:hypothetical protein
MIQVGKRTSILYRPRRHELCGTIEREWIPELRCLAQMLNCPLELEDPQETDFDFTTTIQR